MASPGLITACLALIVPLAGCASGAHQSDTVLTVADPTPDTPKDYVIGPLDKLSIKVFQVQDLSLDAVQVDASGQIVLPLIGNVTASGKTTNQLSQEIAGRLGERYLQSPQVSVIVLQSTSQKVTVEGEVRSPGVFQMAGRTTLMEALAMAGGMSDTANLHHVAVIRTVDGRRKAQICDYDTIRSGRAPDYLIQGNDVVVVDGSNAKAAWKNLLRGLPLVTLLVYAL